MAIDPRRLDCGTTHRGTCAEPNDQTGHKLLLARPQV